MQRIDPRAPRIGAAVTSLISLSGFVLVQLDIATGLSLLGITFALFVWGVFLPKSHPYGLLFRAIRPSLGAPEYLEDPRPPKFAQQVGLSVSGIGLLIAVIDPLAGVLIGLGVVFIASALNAYFDFCLGCVMYLRIRRLQSALAR
ncbi:MAG: DUF4395 domain-containing protein [Microbacteriaceae bacterium]|nr:DUF4395 domain-containing protein [Microbacteriaceae bacterium]MDR9443743.1 DUF4395 domain-containing protein [Microbacteriaceae bacterium]